MPKLLLSLVGTALVLAAVVAMPRAEATVSVAPANVGATVGNTRAVEQVGLKCAHRRVCRPGQGCAWRKVCKGW